MMWLDVIVVLALIVLEGLFAAVEMALVTLREGQVRGLADKGRRGRRVQMLVSDPNRFLSSVQIGVTLSALLAAAFGAVTLTDSVASALRDAGMGSEAAEVFGFIGVTLTISYVTLVVGELAPKRLAIQRAEATSLLLGPALYRLAVLSRPVIWLLSVSTNVVVRLLGGDPRTRAEAITEDELRGLVAAHESLTADERTLIDEIFAVGDRQVREVMLPLRCTRGPDPPVTVGDTSYAATDPPVRRPAPERGCEPQAARRRYRPGRATRRGRGCPRR